MELPSLIVKRLEIFLLLSNIHKGRGYWLNSIKLDPELIFFNISDEERNRRCYEFLCLGFSLGTIFNDFCTTSFVPTLAQLIHEYEWYFHLNYTGVSALSAVQPKPTVSPKQALVKINNVVQFQVFSLIPKIMDYDYFVVTNCLFEIVAALYQKLLDLSSKNLLDFNLFKKIDSVLKERILTRLVSELNTLASKAVLSEIQSIEVMLPSA
ncbi:hypothetical protein RCL1_001315 [Eukaryota sp. TZLM3-RCL]